MAAAAEALTVASSQASSLADAMAWRPRKEPSLASMQRRAVVSAAIQKPLDCRIHKLVGHPTRSNLAMRRDPGKVRLQASRGSAAK